jgi:hypothetical protein
MTTVTEVGTSVNGSIHEWMPWLLAVTLCLVGAALCLRASFRAMFCGQGVHHAHLRSRFLRVFLTVWRLKCSCCRGTCSPALAALVSAGGYWAVNGVYCPLVSGFGPPPAGALRELAILPPVSAVYGADASSSAVWAASAATGAMRPMPGNDADPVSAMVSASVAGS